MSEQQIAELEAENARLRGHKAMMARQRDQLMAGLTEIGRELARAQALAAHPGWLPSEEA